MLYYSFNTYLRKTFNERVQKITIDAGLSCPNRDGIKGVGGCIYCDSRGSGSGASKKYPDIAAQVIAGRDFLARRYKAKKFIVYFQSFCNTCAPPETLKTMFDEAVNLPGIVGLAVATRPDCLSQEVLALLASYTNRLMVWLELGLQTIHDNTLRLINRGHTYQEFLNGYRLARNYPVRICLHVIIGLPGEGREAILSTAREVARLKPDGIKIHSLYIIKGTALEKIFNEGNYHPLEQEAFTALACDFLEVLPEDVVIQRLTGDPAPGELIAPLWTLKKNETLNMIEKEMKQRKSWQGQQSAPA
ncbi:MAG: TIGR01212 family radical SAM protein [Pseudomonadota bacterium]